MSLTQSILYNINRFMLIENKTELMDYVFELFPLQLIIAEENKNPMYIRWCADSNIAVTRLLDSRIDDSLIPLVRLQMIAYRSILSLVVSNNSRIKKIKDDILSRR
jgi:hypothetical protein